jgi:hypothetical protein
MAALTASRDTKRRNGDLMSIAAATATAVFAGGIACVNAGGFATKGAVSTTLKAVGIFEEDANNLGANGAMNFKVRRDGWFKFANSAAADLIALADIGATCYIVDDQTVAKTNGTNTRSAAGIVRDVDADGVWIEFA